MQINLDQVGLQVGMLYTVRLTQKQVEEAFPAELEAYRKEVATAYEDGVLDRSDGTKILGKDQLPPDLVFSLDRYEHGACPAVRRYGGCYALSAYTGMATELCMNVGTDGRWH
jgi:hypothetical protein